MVLVERVTVPPVRSWPPRNPAAFAGCRFPPGAVSPPRAAPGGTTKRERKGENVVTAADWIKVELTEDDCHQAESVAKIRFAAVLAGGRHMNRKKNTLQQHLLGAQGELAVSRYLGIAFRMARSISEDRLGDVGSVQVRTRPVSWWGLGLHQNDRGPFVLVLGHVAPVMWLAGWIEAEDGFRRGALRKDGNWLDESDWWLVDQRDLRALTERNGYSPQGEHWLIDPQLPFWCEACNSSHAIIEHRDCRSALGRLTQQWATKAMKYTYPTTEETGTT